MRSYIVSKMLTIANGRRSVLLRVKLREEKIERLLARKNLSQNWLAKRIEVSSGYMSQLMNGVRYASPRVRAKLQEVFIDSTFDELFRIRNDGGQRRGKRAARRP